MKWKEGTTCGPPIQDIVKKERKKERKKKKNIFATLKKKRKKKTQNSSQEAMEACSKGQDLSHRPGL